MKLFSRTAIILLAGLFTSYRIIKQVDHDDIFDGEINFVLSIITLALLIWIGFKDRHHFIKNRRLTSFFPTILGISIGFGLLMTLYFLQQRDKSPSKLYCVTKIVDFNGAAIDFRLDGTYKLTSWCLGADYYRGTYSIKDSIITLDKSKIEKIVESNKLLIRQDGNIDSLGIVEKSIYQIDQTGQIIKSAIDFRVLEK